MGRPLIDALVAIEVVDKVTQVAAWPVFEATTAPARVMDRDGALADGAAFPRMITGDGSRWLSRLPGRSAPFPAIPVSIRQGVPDPAFQTKRGWAPWGGQ